MLCILLFDDSAAKVVTNATDNNDGIIMHEAVQKCMGCAVCRVAVYLIIYCLHIGLNCLLLRFIYSSYLLVNVLHLFWLVVRISFIL